MIIDDEEELLNSLSNYFPWEKLGFTVCSTAQNARNALKYLEENNVDVLLTDIRLPLMSGLELIQKAKELPSPPLFCIMSAHVDFDYAKKAIQLGVEDYIVKPSSFSEIEVVFNKIKEKLDKKSMVPMRTQDVSYDNPMINQAINIIQKRLSDCSLTSIAFELGINEAYLSRLFKKCTGQNFQDYLLEKKMLCAQSMLESPAGYKNNDIAQALGYQDTQNFCRVFKKRFGQSPQQYRNMISSKGSEA